MRNPIRVVLKRLIRRARTIPFLRRIADRVFQQWYGLPVPPLHFYSPLPDMAALAANRDRWLRPDPCPGIEWNLEGQRRLLGDLEAFRPECDELPGLREVTAEGYGEGYGEVEARMLHAFVRSLKPGRVIEVGSGVSTWYTLNALARNRDEGDGDGELVCIEPYPRQALRDLAGRRGFILHEREVQDVDLQLFGSLEEGDLLFIDSSHVSKVDSDVEYLHLQVLPGLREGVVVHIHDIPFPYLTLPADHPLLDHSLLWNEAALVRALLIHTSAFEILQCQSYLHREHPEEIRRIVSAYDPREHFPASLWLRKTR